MRGAAELNPLIAGIQGVQPGGALSPTTGLRIHQRVAGAEPEGATGATSGYRECGVAWLQSCVLLPC